MEEPVLKKMMNTMPQQGEVVWIGVRPASKQPLLEKGVVLAEKGTGLSGDRFQGKRSTKREVTLIQQEHIDAVSSILGKEVKPDELRRNIVVRGINLLSLKNQRFVIGEALLETTGLCHPCSRMETNLGPGGYNAMRGHGGITARIIQSGEIRVGSTVYLSVSGF